MELHCAYNQLVCVSDLKPHPKNPNTHSAAQVAAIAAVIEGNGWRAPISVPNRSGFITRARAALRARRLQPSGSGALSTLQLVCAFNHAHAPRRQIIDGCALQI